MFVLLHFLPSLHTEHINKQFWLLKWFWLYFSFFLLLMRAKKAKLPPPPNYKLTPAIKLHDLKYGAMTLMNWGIHRWGVRAPSKARAGVGFAVIGWQKRKKKEYYAIEKWSRRHDRFLNSHFAVWFLPSFQPDRRAKLVMSDLPPKNCHFLSIQCQVNQCCHFITEKMICLIRKVFFF